MFQPRDSTRIKLLCAPEIARQRLPAGLTVCLSCDWPRPPRLRAGAVRCSQSGASTCRPSDGQATGGQANTNERPLSSQLLHATTMATAAVDADVISVHLSGRARASQSNQPVRSGARPARSPLMADGSDRGARPRCTGTCLLALACSPSTCD